MKKLALTIIALFVMVVQASAMSYEQAREQALFLTDKMAYELNLTDDQYEAAYEINLDYLMSIDHRNDLYGTYWTQRNLDLSYILLDWQYRAYVEAAYFYRPLYWDSGYWHFGIYARYPHRDYFYFGRPHFYVSYRGGHSWRVNGGRSWYNGRHYGRAHVGGGARVGMRDGFDRGDFGRGSRISSQHANRSFGNGRRTTTSTYQGTRSFGNGNRGIIDNRAQQSRRSTFGEGRQSSTRSTVTRPGSTRSFGGSSSEPRRTFVPNENRGSTRSFGGSSQSSGRSFGGTTQARPSSSFGGSSQAPTRSFGSGGVGRSGGGSTGGHFGRGR